MSDARIIQELPLPQFGGLVFPPYETITLESKNRLAGRATPYVNASTHDDTGRESMTFTTRMLFLNTLLGHGLGTLFPDYWNLWLPLLSTGTARELRHPVVGDVLSRVDGFKFPVTGAALSGIVVDVTFVQTNEDPGTFELFGGVSFDPASLAAAADDLCAPFDIVLAEGRLPVMFESMYGMSFPSGFSQPTLLQAYQAIRATLFTASVVGAAALTSLMADVQAMTLALDALNRCDAWQARQALVAFWASLNSSLLSLARATRPTRSEVVGGNGTTLDAFAAAHGNTLAEVMALNLKALHKPRVERGSLLTYYVAS